MTTIIKHSYQFVTAVVATLLINPFDGAMQKLLIYPKGLFIYIQTAYLSIKI